MRTAACKNWAMQQKTSSLLNVSSYRCRSERDAQFLLDPHPSVVHLLSLWAQGYGRAMAGLWQGYAENSSGSRSQAGDQVRSFQVLPCGESRRIVRLLAPLFATAIPGAWREDETNRPDR